MRKLISQTIVIGQALLLVLFATASWAGSDVSSKNIPARLAPGAVEQSLSPQTSPERAAPPEITITEERSKGLQGGQGVKLTLSAIAFEGNEVFSDEELLAQVHDYLGQTIAVDELQRIADVITAYYHKNGYILSHAYLPPQTIAGGTAVIAVTEGRLGRVIVVGNKRYKAEMIEKIMDQVREKGALSGLSLEKGALLVNDLPGLSAKATLVAGKIPGTTDIIMEVKESKIWQVGFDYNNFGSEYVSQNRFGLNLSFFNPFRLGDAFDFRFMTGPNSSDTDGPMWYLRGEYSLPINSYGTRVGLAGSSLKYSVGEELEDLNLTGCSDLVSLWISHPFSRSRYYSWWLDGGYDLKRVSNKMLNQSLYEEDLNNVHVGSHWEWIDAYLGRNVTSLRITKGLSDEDIGSRLFANGEFMKIEGEYNRFQAIPWHDMTAIFSANFQMANDRMPTCEELSLGGAGTVRGYPMSDYSGDDGIYGTLEVRYPIYKGQIDWQKASGLYGDWAVEAALFTDMGRVWTKDSIPAELDSATLGSVGAGLRVAYVPYAEAKIEWAKYILGDQPSDEGVKEDGAWYFQISAAY